MTQQFTKEIKKELNKMFEDTNKLTKEQIDAVLDNERLMFNRVGEDILIQIKNTDKKYEFFKSSQTNISMNYDCNRMNYYNFKQLSKELNMIRIVISKFSGNTARLKENFSKVFQCNIDTVEELNFSTNKEGEIVLTIQVKFKGDTMYFKEYFNEKKVIPTISDESIRIMYIYRFLEDMKLRGNFHKVIKLAEEVDGEVISKRNGITEFYSLRSIQSPNIPLPFQLRVKDLTNNIYLYTILKDSTFHKIGISYDNGKTIENYELSDELNIKDVVSTLAT